VAKITQNQYSFEDLTNFCLEAQEVHGTTWRPFAWYSEQMVDGIHWTDTEYQKAVDAGIFDIGEEPIVINRIFPTIQLMLGLQITNKLNTIAKGKTSKDSELGNIVTEGIQYINDQNGTDFLISKAYRDQCVPGVGYLKVGHNSDPRQEIISIRYRDWKDMYWDPFADPWLDPNRCRYAFHMPFVDLQDLITAYPKHKEELEDYTSRGSIRHSFNSQVASMWDESQRVEDYKSLWGSGNRFRKRVRPVEMWYPVWRSSLWTTFQDGQAYELTDDMNPKEKFDIIQACESVVRAPVRRMWTTSFLDDVILNDGPTPYNHDRYPFVPFVGYLDRNGLPYGVPHQLKGQSAEVNKRRAMILAMLRKKRVIIGTDAVSEKNSQNDIDNLTRQAQRLDGVMVIKANGRFDFVDSERTGELQAQLQMLHESEREIQEISGANAEMQGVKGQTISGTAIEKRQAQSSVILSPLLENLRRSKKIMGELEHAEMQGQWRGPRILRITDRVRGKETWEILNEVVPDHRSPTGYTTKNNMSQGKFDIIISEAPATDTVREQNLNLITEAVKKSPPEIIPQLITMAFEMSDLPNKDMLVNKLKQIYKLDPGMDDMSPEQQKTHTIKVLREQQEEAKKQSQYETQEKGLTLKNLSLENQYLQAQIDRLLGQVKNDDNKMELEGFKTGVNIADRKMKNIKRSKEQTI
jgi:hypothetical protein